MDLTNTRNSISLIDNRNDIDLRNVRRPPSATGGRRANPELCTYHTRFGAKAMNCQPGCGWADKKRQSGVYKVLLSLIMYLGNLDKVGRGRYSCIFFPMIDFLSLFFFFPSL